MLSYFILFFYFAALRHLAGNFFFLIYIQVKLFSLVLAKRKEHFQCVSITWSANFNPHEKTNNMRGTWKHSNQTVLGHCCLLWSNGERLMVRISHQMVTLNDKVLFPSFSLSFFGRACMTGLMSSGQMGGMWQKPYNLYYYISLGFLPLPIRIGYSPF